MKFWHVSFSAVEKPIIKKQLPNIAASEGNPVKLKMDFSGKPQPQVTWLKGDKPIHNSHVHKVNKTLGLFFINDNYYAISTKLGEVARLLTFTR